MAERSVKDRSLNHSNENVVNTELSVVSRYLATGLPNARLAYNFQRKFLDCLLTADSAITRSAGHAHSMSRDKLAACTSLRIFNLCGELV